MGYTFNWNLYSGPTTDDPQWIGKLTRGPHNHVFCDGVEIPEATRYCTGPNGWVEYLKLDGDGKIIIDRVTHCAVREIVHGNVEYKPDAQHA